MITALAVAGAFLLAPLNADQTPVMTGEGASIVSTVVNEAPAQEGEAKLLRHFPYNSIQPAHFPYNVTGVDRLLRW